MENGGSTAASPNAAFVQARMNLVSGHIYVFKLKWKTNRAAPGTTIFAGTGNVAPFSATTLTSKQLTPGLPRGYARSTSQQALSNSDGASWMPLGAPDMAMTLNPDADGAVVLGANADLFTGSAGVSQDLGIFVSDNGQADGLVGWKEIGGLVGAFSPDAAYVKAKYPVKAGHSYTFKLKWKSGAAAAGKTNYSGAGPIGGQYSPTSLLAEFIPSSANPPALRSTQHYSLANSDGSTWQTIAAGLTGSMTPSAQGTLLLGANVNLYTTTAGIGQDVGIFASDNGGPEVLLAWKESAGSAASSPNAVYVQVTYPIQIGHQYLFKLKWKANRAVPGSVIHAGVGSGGAYSPTLFIAEYVRTT
jgi:hypothetical protein